MTASPNKHRRFDKNCFPEHPSAAWQRGALERAILPYAQQRDEGRAYAKDGMRSICLYLFYGKSGKSDKGQQVETEAELFLVLFHDQISPF